MRVSVWLFWLAQFAAAGGATAADVAVVGLFPGKAVLVVDGAAPRTIGIGGTTPEGVRLLSIDGDFATVEIDGKRQRLGIGDQVVSQGGPEGGGAVTLTADARGHFVTGGIVNGASVRFLIDTGATMVSLGATDAARAGVDFRRGEPVMTMTANGPARAYKTRISSLKIGEIALSDVDALVHAYDMPVALLGMSFLNRMEMRRDGQTMTLRRRY
ncbi:MAG: TIGR02281 family clan AA aspartic protease [Sterolibacteriaceae bacterium]|uniref:TIGR02281 family clan AA aspartic protease n=1 Tax=Candidatus Methylophosphatis roskildensis TaxID=2899263 RepID=A0A9D7E7S6_9PROT|nr:TIGR02281 family clan AA aspartic protease [Candidatus Methylophosphatis roskildensis]MBK7235479.1 TIGR02281 family clan AA aspartic protease [Sterolibacteriaceae bacterium]MBK7663398.1 TIGR02281 family clan AA aspartic protease [Sterolibacteriaceae bacterium]MBK9083738.1 TIGR02281 family clan AA aspartic protease [Sterolibacteriaceae bacterium]